MKDLSEVIWNKVQEINPGDRDECRHCLVRGNIQACLETECNHNSNWLVQELMQKLMEAEEQRSAT